MKNSHASCTWQNFPGWRTTPPSPSSLRNTELWKKQRMIRKLPHNKSLVEVLSLTITTIFVVVAAASARSAFSTLQPQHGFVVLSKTKPITPCVCTLVKKLLNKNARQTGALTPLSLYHFTSHLLPRFHQEERSRLHNPLAGMQIMLVNAGAVAHQILSAESGLLSPHYCWDWI